MKLRFHAPSADGFTLLETMISISISTLVGGMIFILLSSGMNLYARNTAINAAHQQARSGVDQMLQNIHGSVSIPQLVEIDPGTQTFAAIDAPGTGPASGLTFQRFEAGPFPVTVNAAASSSSITLTSSSYVPSGTARLNIPAHQIELDVASSTYLGSNQRLFNFASPIGSDVTIVGDGDDDQPNPYIITAFMTYRVSYAVVGTELRYFPTNDVSNYKVIARNVTSSKPFTIPTLSGGGLQNRYVAAVNISTVEPQFTQRGYAAVNMFISSLVPFRCRLTETQ